MNRDAGTEERLMMSSQEVGLKSEPEILGSWLSCSNPSELIMQDDLRCGCKRW
jgi:hypothetical protein